MSTKKVTRYLKPCYTAIVSYQGHVVAMERHPLGSMGALSEEIDGVTRHWTPRVTRNFKQLVKPLVERGDRQWFFDGRYVFSFTGGFNQLQVAESGVHLTKDGKFRKVMAQAIDLQSLGIEEKLMPVERSCLAFVSSRNLAAISPPIWKDLSDVGTMQLKRANSTTDDDDLGDDEDISREDKTAMAPAFNFDAVNESLCVNLNFALKAGVEIGRTFGYEYVEPLQLPRMMTELHTVNLPNVPKQIKATYDVQLDFLSTLAWLLGLSRRANTLETYVMMRSLMKYLTTKGIFRSNVFSAGAVFKEGKTINDVKTVKLDTLLNDDDFSKKALTAIIDKARTSKRSRDNTTHSIGGLLNEE